MTRRAPKLPAPTMQERADAAIAARALAAAIADPSTMGAKTAVHVDLARPRRGEWWESWANLPGFHRIDGKAGRYIHALLPGWSYARHEIRAEMIPDLEAMAERGERPTEDTSGRVA